VELLRSHTGRVLVSAHRGASGYVPENTMAAFLLAQAQGADMIELDVHLSADDRLVVIHDDTLERTTNGVGYVRDQPWSLLSTLDAGDGERIPLLEDVLAWAHTIEMPLNVELKRPNAALDRAPYPRLVERVIDAVRCHDLLARVLVFSDDHTLVRRTRQLEPRLATAIVLGLGTFIDPVGLAKQAGADGVALYWRYCSRELVSTFHAAGLHIFGFGVGDNLDEPEGLEAVLANGTDFVSSGQPDRLRAFVDAWSTRP
jgi:glycerophosphoryl diester phosphodiesterase